MKRFWVGVLLVTNAASFENAPKWLTALRVNRVVDHVVYEIPWSIHRVRVRWFDSASEFAAAHGLKSDGSSNILAVTKKNENEMDIGPGVNTKNFDGVFGHELVHVIISQKYGIGAIPPWLEEGLANYTAKRNDVRFVEIKKYLNEHPDFDVRTLGHPFSGNTVPGVSADLQYSMSTVLMQSIAAHCDAYDLLQMATGKGNSVEGWLEKICDISDLNKTFRDYVAKRAK